MKREVNMGDECKYVVDEKGRLVRKVVLGGKTCRYYVGSTIQGFIQTDSKGEYIMVQDEKRYWKGISIMFPDELLLLKDFSLCILKPDCSERGLVKEIRSIITSSFEMLKEKTVSIDQQMAFRLYPYFFENTWEAHLLNYLTSGSSLCLLLSGPDIFRELMNVRNYIQFKYKDERKRHPVYNLIHCADNKESAIRESLVFFNQDELTSKVGLSE